MQQMEWFEVLPQNCPPEQAYHPDSDTFYRVVKTIPPGDKDFYSQRKLCPTKYFSAEECIVRAISIFISLECCVQILKLPKFRNKRFKVVSIILCSESGVILQTRSKGHYSWWRAKNYYPVPDCHEVKKVVYEEYMRIEK